MQRSSNSWPVVVALLALIGFAVARHTSDRAQFQPESRTVRSRLCQVNSRPCNSVERLRSIRGLQLDQR